MHIKSTLVILLLLLTSLSTYADSTIAWYNGKEAISYYTNKKVDPVVAVALQMFQSDMLQVTGTKCIQRKKEQASIYIVDLNRENGAKWLQKKGIPVKKLRAKKDAFFIKVIDNKQILIVGSDGRGTAYGILELSRMAGVSPWVWWGDVKPRKKDCLTIPADYQIFQSPSVEYRGIFLNDEDWSLQPWSWKNYSPGKPGFISAKTYKKIFQLLMRLRANAIWPGMHGMTTPFYLVSGAKEVADSCGIMIGTSHCEPLMRNNVGEWSVEQRGRYNYMTNKEAVQNYWIERLKECGKYENFYTIGMRGVHDSGMEGVKGLDAQTSALQQVINDQRVLLKKYVNKDVTQLPQQFVPYKEVLQIMENGLVLPDDITLTWCDDNYGYMTRLSDSTQQKRSGGGGIYYHLSYWGRPHDYMWLATTQPGLIYNEMRHAFDCNVRKLWIANVHDMKTPAYDLELFLDLAWNINSVSASTLWKHQEEWLAREFSSDVAHRLMPAMKEFWRLTNIRRPEFMGWNQVEIDKDKRGHSWRNPVEDVAFSLTEFGNEFDRYLSDWRKVAHQINQIEVSVPANRRDAYFSHIKYPVLGAQAMSIKMFEAQRAYSIAKANYNPERWERDSILYTAAAKSMSAYQNIRSLTKYWNDSLANGKWKYSMCDHPRDLYVFNAPSLPIVLSEEESKKYVSLPDVEPASLASSVGDSCIVRNACQYSQAEQGAEAIQSLGHSMQAVSLPKGKTLTYEFISKVEGEAVLRTAVIPTQPDDKGDIRFSVSIDRATPVICSFKEGFRTESWKQNVLRGQAIRTIPLTLSKGKHTLKITALDSHVIIDQWMIDFIKERKFYVFPIKPVY